MDETDGGPPRIDEHDRQVGLKHLRALRAELRHDTAQPDAEASVVEASDKVMAAPRATEHTNAQPSDDDELDVSRMTAEMAVAAERDLLEQRITALEHEVASLRNALAAILTTAASAVAHDPGGPRVPSNDLPDQT